jgi:hypothetical protein
MWNGGQKIRHGTTRKGIRHKVHLLVAGLDRRIWNALFQLNRVSDDACPLPRGISVPKGRRATESADSSSKS